MLAEPTIEFIPGYSMLSGAWINGQTFILSLALSTTTCHTAFS